MIEPTETSEHTGQEPEAKQDEATGKAAPRRRRSRTRRVKRDSASEAALGTGISVAETIESPPATEHVDSGSALTGTEESATAPRPKSRRRRSRSRRGKRDKTEQSIEQTGEPAPIEPADATAVDGVVEHQAEPVADGDQQAAATGNGKRRRRRGRKGKRPEGAAAPDVDSEPAKKPKDRTKRILINARYADEKRVAIVEGDRLVDFYVENATREHLKGNIYKGVVTTLMPSLQAVFVDFGQKKHGFLKYREVMPELFEGDKKDKKDSESGLVKGQEILVQVVKDERDTKGASLTTYISIPGRYIVMMPGQQRVGISRKIENREDRDRLKDTFHALKLPKDTGFILRTACGDLLEEELSRDLNYLTKLWDRIKAIAKKEKAPALIYKEQDISMRTVRDYLTSDVVEILIDDAKTCTATRTFLKKIMPWREVNLTHYTEKSPLFSLYNVEGQIARLSQRIVNLPSRGYLVFDKTEALTAIDVNSGRSRKEENIEATALTTNLEAAEEVGRQLRLRDIGGLVAIDFIDMESAKNRKLVEARMQEALSTDKASTELASLSKFCIMELTRERIRPAYADAISRRCPLCEGIGIVNSDDFVAIGALRELHALAAAGEASAITCRLPVESANVLINTRRKELAALEQEHGIAITILADPSTPAGQCAIEAQKKK